jgi:Uma2 family endonuclease
MTAGLIQARRCTPAEYLHLDRADAWKNEYLNGEIRPMPRVGRDHILIMGNIGSELLGQLRGKPCDVFMARMRVLVRGTGLYTYPDVVVASTPVHCEHSEDDTLLIPMLIVEVLSPASEAYDRGEKFAHYRRLDSLREYVLVSQDQALVDRYVRQGDLWVLSEISGLDAVLSLDAIGCAVRLADIYERVDVGSEARALASDDESAATS